MYELTVAPEAPTAAANPTAATCNLFGNNLVIATIAAGNKGARNCICQEPIYEILHLTHKAQQADHNS